MLGSSSVRARARLGARLGQSEMGAAVGSLAWDAPGVGRWRLDADHAERPVCRVGRDIYAGMEVATVAAYGSVGLATRCMRIVFVNGWPYVQIEMVDDADELARREENARAAVEDLAWRDIVDEWFDAGRIEFIDRALLAYRQHDTNAIGADPVSRRQSLGAQLRLLSSRAKDRDIKRIARQAGYLARHSARALNAHERRICRLTHWLAPRNLLWRIAIFKCLKVLRDRGR